MNEIDNTTEARITGVTFATPTVAVTASATGQIEGLVAVGSGAGTGAGVAAVITNDIDSTTSAHVSGGANVTSTSSLSVSASDTSDIDAIAGGLAFSGTASLAAAIALNEIDSSVEAYIDNATVNGGAVNVTVSSTSTIDVAAAGGAVSGTASLSGSDAENDINASLLATVRNGASVTGSVVNVTASDTSTIDGV